MSNLRDHTPIVLEEFNGLWRNGDKDATPIDHWSSCSNVQFIQNGFKTRDGIEPYLEYGLNILRIYTFIQETGQSILILDDQGNIYDSGSPTPFTPILTISQDMIDFGFVSMNGRAYLSPCQERIDLPQGGISGMQNEFLYVYEGDGTPARKAAGNAPTDADGALAAANSGSAGNVEAGVHIFGVVYETTSGFLSSIGPDTLPFVTAPGGEEVDLSNIPVSPSSFVTKVHIVATKSINPTLYTGDTRGYQFFFVPGAIVNNGVTTFTVSFFDSELLDDASQLQDLFTEIPAGVGLTTYHGRLVSYGEYDNISLVRVSNVGEPEAINQVDGLLEVPLDGVQLTNGQEFRDILYIFKQIRTFAFTDNGDVPSSWPRTILDQGIGCSVRGLATVLDSGGVNIDYLILIDYSGVMLFNGAYVRPELSWKIRDLWLNLNRFLLNQLQIMNDSLTQVLYITLPDPDRQMLIGDYSNGLDPEKIRWSAWIFDINTTTITLIDTKTLIIGSNGRS